jgi:F-type H+-transporting ATPase subunit delta
MSERADALRYARELFEVTWRHGTAPQVADELDDIVGATRNGSDARVLFHPLVPRAKKAEAVRALVAGAGLSKPTAVLLGALVKHHALFLLGPVAASFRERLHQRQGVVRATVTTAAPLPAGTAAALTARLSEVAGRQVTLQMQVNPAIIGGVVTQIDSTVYDGSVTRQLARMRQKLVENV